MLHRLTIVALAVAATTVFSLEEYQFLSSCDERSVPYRISINGHGKPEISCAQPSCLGDEYKSHDKKGSHVRHNAFNVTCNGYRDGQCDGEDQWVAGFMEVYTEGRKGNEVVFKTKCCNYPGLVLATPVKTVVLQTDEEFTGGAYVRSEGLGGFDIIKEVKRRVMRNGVARYEVTIVRMPCQLDDLDDYDQDGRGGRTGYAGGSLRKSYHGYGRYGRRQSLYRSPFRPFGFRRRNQPDDYYYDDEEEFYQPRRRFELRHGRERVRIGGNVLWPIAYKSRARAYGADTEDATYDQIPEEIQVKGSDEHPQMVLVVQKPTQVQMPAYPAQTQDSTYVNSQVGPAPQQVPAPIQQPVQQVQQVQQQGYQEGPPAPQPAPQQQIVDGGVTYAPMVPPVPDFQQPQVAQGVQQGGYAVGPQQVVESPPVQQVYQPAYGQPASSYSYGSSATGTCGSTCGCGGCMNSFLGAMQCFSGDVEVETTTGMKKMTELEIGDIVMSHEEGVVTYSPVVMFLHYLEEEEAQFFKITAEDKTLELTSEHLIYVSSCNNNENSRLVPAKDVVVGDCVNFPNGNGLLRKARVSQIDMVQKKGIYAPLTLTGDIIVNGMLASCHSNLGVKILQQSFFGLYRTMSDFFYSFTSMEMFTYGKQLPTGVRFVTSVMDLFLPQSFL